MRRLVGRRGGYTYTDEDEIGKACKSWLGVVETRRLVGRRCGYTYTDDDDGGNVCTSYLGVVETRRLVGAKCGRAYDDEDAMMETRVLAGWGWWKCVGWWEGGVGTHILMRAMVETRAVLREYNYSKIITRLPHGQKCGLNSGFVGLLLFLAMLAYFNPCL